WIHAGGVYPRSAAVKKCGAHFVRSTLECGGKATALGGRWNRDGPHRVMLATFAMMPVPPPSQSGGSVATALQSFAKCAVGRASIKRCMAHVRIESRPAF